MLRTLCFYLRKILLNVKKHTKWNFVCVSCVAFFLAIMFLNLFCFVYSYSGIRIPCMDKSTNIKYPPNQYIANMTEGFAWRITDDNGYLNAKEAKAFCPNILLMGSSHMEALQVSTENTVASLLNRHYSTYCIGISGHFITKCVKNMPMAIKHYQPKKLLILETLTVTPPLEDMKSALDNKDISVKEVPESLRHSIAVWVYTYLPIYRQMINRLIEWYNINNNFPSDRRENNRIYNENYSDILNKFLEKASLLAKENKIKILIFYHPNVKIGMAGDWVRMTRSEDLSLFRNICEKNDIIFIDMSPYFEKLYLEHNLLPRGFANTRVGVGHINEIGHRVIAHELLKKINELEENTCL